MIMSVAKKLGATVYLVVGNKEMFEWPQQLLSANERNAVFKTLSLATRVT
jgi:uncharacterized protein involved in tolerance to divalent cations